MTEAAEHCDRTVQLALDAQTFENVEQLAAVRNYTVEEYLQELVSQLGKPSGRLLGLFRDEPELLDQIVEEAMIARQTHPLRLPRDLKETK